MILALPETTFEPKRFIALGIFIVEMTLMVFNAIKITILDGNISNLKNKTDMLLDVICLQEQHVHYLEDKFKQKKDLLADVLEMNVLYITKVMDTVQKEVPIHLPPPLKHHQIGLTSQTFSRCPSTQYPAWRFKSHVSGG
jgi:hypothetical protein